jgi:glycosyltransferase involved in cell wall biosynthesis
MVLCVGHLIERKDPLLSLEVFLRGAPPDAHLVWIGRGELRQSMLDRALGRGAAGRVHCLGEVQPEQLVLWYGASNLLLLTSRREGRPNVVLEALACGRPVLATAAGGTAEVLEGPDGMLGGMVAQTRDADALAQELARLLQVPFDPLALRARVAGLSWRASTDRLEACLERACAEATRA